MEKITIGKMPALAVPAVIVGAQVNGKPNYLTLGCFGVASIAKPTVFIMSARQHYTNVGIRETGCFSVNIPSPDIVRETDYVGLVSGQKVDKSAVFRTFYGPAGVPMIEECPVTMTCRVVGTHELPNVPNHEIFYGEVEEVYVSKGCFTDGEPDLKKISPLLLGAGSYLSTGGPVGTAWKEGIPLIKK